MNGQLTEVHMGRLIAQVCKKHEGVRSTRTLMEMMSIEWVEKLNVISLDEDNLYIWEQSPYWLLDRYWGIDFLLNDKGWCFGVDITREDHPTKLRDKRNKQSKAAFVKTCPAIGQVDACAVWVINGKLPTAKQVREVLKSMRSQKEFSQTYYL